MMPGADEMQIRAILATIMDPCSVGMGCPLSIEAMGLVPTVEIRSDAIAVSLRLTQPGCHFAALLQQEIEERITEYAGTRSVQVSIIDDLTWSETDISPEGRSRLRATREARLLRLKGVTLNGNE